jgi:epoxyqueuosine reductase
MGYLADRLDERLDPGAYIAGARSAVCVAMNYHVPLAAETRGADGAEGPWVPGKIARYALGEDYHEWMKRRLYALADYLRELVPGSRTRSGVDTVPIPEREFAAKAGIGWVGKNTCVINERVGSWLFLGTVLTTAELPEDGPTPDRCGTCTRCLDACPTGALSPERPYEMAATKCISYVTIENRGEIPAEIAPKLSGWLYGCDICQDVCPWNRRAPTATDPRLAPRHPTGTVNAAEIAGWTEAEWFPFSRRTAIRRLGLPLLKRNAAALVGAAKEE